MGKADELLAKAAEQEAQFMTLLLTTARILRAHLNDHLRGDIQIEPNDPIEDEIAALEEALAPFGATPDPPINEAAAAK